MYEAAKEFFEMCDESSVVFALMYDDLVQQGSFGGPDVGSPSHMRKVYDWCKHILLTKGEGLEGKSSRWWAFKLVSRRAHQCRATDLLVLLWIGWRRRWWKRIEDCPVVARNIQPAADDGGALLGEEALVEEPGEEEEEAQGGAQPSTVAGGAAEQVVGGGAPGRQRRSPARSASIPLGSLAGSWRTL